MIFRPFRNIYYCVKSVIIIYSSRLRVWVLIAVCVRYNSPVYFTHSDMPLRKSRLLLLRYFVLSEESISMADSSWPSSSINVGNLVCHVLQWRCLAHLHSLWSTFPVTLPSYYLFYSSHTFKYYFQMYIVVNEHGDLGKTAPI